MSANSQEAGFLSQPEIDRARRHLAGTRAAFELAIEHGQNAIAHPVMGPLDAYQWVLPVSAHAERRVDQIAEVRAHAGFPG